jgi:phosphoribosylanthranilate isomerase
MRPRIKICGMKHNVAEVAGLRPDYLGFIFYENSPRNFTSEIPKLAEDIIKVGVFVNATIDFIYESIRKHQLNVIQLHGNETPVFCEALRNKRIKTNDETVRIWKVFHILDHFDFNSLQPYENCVDAFLFDTKGTTPGGTGLVFDWQLLSGYNSETPFVLSGGIGLKEAGRVKEVIKTGLPVLAIDVNSRFEKKPGLKDVEELKKFIDELSCK